MRFARPFAALGAALLALSVAAEDPPRASAGSNDWPQYRGARRDGTTELEAKTKIAWPAAGPAISWRRALGSAFSQLAVRGDAVLTGVSDHEQEYVVRLDAATGEEVWRTPVGAVFESEFGNGPRSTPTISGEWAYFLGARGRLACVMVGDGSVVWSVDLTERFGAPVPRFGFGGSPLVVEDLVLIEVGHKDQPWLAALAREDGATRWTVLGGPAGYSSPVVAVLAGTRQILTERGKTITALDIDGAVLWTYELEEPAIAMPLSVGGDRIFVSAMGDTGCVMLRVRRAEGGWSVEELWKNRGMRNHFNSSVFVAGHIYGFDNATLKCLSAETGETKWAKRGFGKGSLAVAGGWLFVLSDRGQVALVEAAAEEYREAGVLQVLDGKSWTAPSFAGGRLYVRNLKESACLDFGS